MKMDTKLLKNIIKTTNEVRKKYKAIKSGKIDKEMLLEETFKPITKPLKELKEERKIKRKLNDETMISLNDDDSRSFEIPSLFKKKIKKMDHTDDSIFQTPDKTLTQNSTPMLKHSLNKSLKEEEEEENESLLPYYIEKVKYHNRDNIYGPKYNESQGTFTLGRSEITFNDNNKINVGEKEYSTTRGLLQLIFMKKPNSYTSEDLKNYGDILHQTNVFRKDVNDEHSQIKGNRGQKYKHIISKLIKTKQGEGLMTYNSNKPNYVYWDDPNELVDRLRLLIASQEAGHTSHNNEIMSIIEELREANIIV